MSAKRLAIHASTFGIRRSDAVRLEHFLGRLHGKHHAIHGEARIVPYRSKTTSTALVCTFDGAACGCAMCGEYATDAGESIRSGFKVLHVGNTPVDVSRLVGPAAILYCDACMTEHGAWLREAFHITETRKT